MRIQNIRYKISVVLIGIVISTAIIGIGVGGWKLKRWINYTWGYESQVELQVKPLTERIDKLEKRVEQLEKTSK